MSGLSSTRYKSPPSEPPHSSIFRKRARLSPAVSDPDLEGSWPLKRHVTEFYASDLNWACTTSTHDPGEAKPTHPSSSAFAPFTSTTSPLPIPSCPPPSLLTTSPPPVNEQQPPPRPSSASEHSMEEEVMLASGSSRMSTDMPVGGSPPRAAAAATAARQPSFEMPEEVTSRAAFPPSLSPASATPGSSGAAAGIACSMGLPPIPSPIPGLSRRRNNNSMLIGMPRNEASDIVPASPSDPGASIMTNLRKTALLRSTSMLSMQKCLQASGISTRNAQPSPQQQLIQSHPSRGWSQQHQQQAETLPMQQMQHNQEFRNWPPFALTQQQQQQQSPTQPQEQQLHQPPKQPEAKQPWRGSAVSTTPASCTNAPAIRINAPAAAGAAFASSNHGAVPPSTAQVPLPPSPIAQSLAANCAVSPPAPQSTKPMLMHPSPRHFPALNILTQDPPPFPLQPLGSPFCQAPLLSPPAAMDSAELQQQESNEDLPSAAPILGSDAMSL